jgi:hypothetical protein
MKMTEPPGAAIASALASQRGALTATVERLAWLGRASLPDGPTGAWHGPAESAYRARLEDLRREFAATVRELEWARVETDRALATLAFRVG